MRPGCQRAMLLVLALALAGLSCGRLSGALQLTEAPSHYSVLSGPGPHQKLLITLKTRSVTSRADAEEVARLSHDSRVQVMTTSGGQRYACRIPIQHPPSAAAAAAEAAEAAAAAAPLATVNPAAAAAGATTSSSDGTAASAFPKAPVELLDQLRSLCLYRQEGLWTYEVCYKKQTRQFRQAMQRFSATGQAEPLPAEDFSCGSYAEQQELSIRQDFSSTGIPMTYLSHNMTGGAPCIMTGLPRTSEVRYTCMPHAKDNMLVLVKEFPTCNYIFVVATPFLCMHPQFQPPPQRTHTIRCTLAEPQQADAEAGAAGSPPPSPSPATAVQVEPPGQCAAGGEGGGSTCSIEAGAKAGSDGPAQAQEAEPAEQQAQGEERDAQEGDGSGEEEGEIEELEL